MPRLPLALLLGAILLVAGCISPDATTPGATTEDPEATEPAPTTAVVHRARPAVAAENATTDPVTLPTLVITPELPLPVGVARHSPLSSFEPTLGVGPDGAVYLSTFANPTPKRTLLQKSVDGGLTWADVTPGLGPVSLPPQSNDPYVYVDPDNGRIFLSDLQALICSTLSFSDDGGASWVTNPLGCGHPVGGQDHQTVFTATPRMVTTVGYDKVVYYCINRVADSACATSLNGGISFGPLRPLVYTGIEPCGGLIAGGLHAHGAAAPDGTVYIPKGHCGVPTVAISQDDGLTWETVTIADGPRVNGHEVPFAVDEAGNAYAIWISDEDRLPYLATSADGGRTWNAPVMVAPPGVGTAAFPSIAAGSDGRIAMAFYGTAAAKEYADMEANDTWNGYITIATDALSADMTLASVTVNDPADPIARGVCGGTRCNGVGDFIDIVIDAEGRPWGAFVDVCNDECATPAGEANLKSFGFVGTLLQGYRLRGELEALPALPTAANEPAE